MPSYSADKIIHTIELYLGRSIFRDELYGVEEMALNYYASAILKFIVKASKMEVPRGFDFIYVSVMSGHMWGAKKNIGTQRIGHFF